MNDKRQHPAYYLGLVEGWEVGLSEGIERGYQMANDDIAALQRKAVAIARGAAKSVGYDPYCGNARDVAEGDAIRARLGVSGGARR